VITEVKVYPLKKDHPKIKANGTIVIDDKYKVRVTIRASDKGLWVGLPGRYDENKKDDQGRPVWYNDFQAITKDAHKEIADIVLDAYGKETAGTPAPQGDAEGPTNQDGETPPF